MHGFEECIRLYSSVESLNNGHIEACHAVHCREVVHISEVNVLTL